MQYGKHTPKYVCFLGLIIFVEAMKAVCLESETFHIVSLLLYVKHRMPYFISAQPIWKNTWYTQYRCSTFLILWTADNKMRVYIELDNHCSTLLYIVSTTYNKCMWSSCAAQFHTEHLMYIVVILAYIFHTMCKGIVHIPMWIALHFSALVI